MSEKKSFRSTILAVVVFLVIMTAVLYVCFAYYYMRTIFPNTIINGIDCSEMQVERVEAVIKKKVEDYSISLIFRDGSTNVIHGKDINYEYIPSGEVRQILKNQDVWKWIFCVFQKKEYEVSEDIQFEEILLKEKVSSMENLSPERQIQPEDAYIMYKIGGFVIIPETEGNLIRQDDLYHEIRQAVSNSVPELNIAELSVYEEPKVRLDSPKLIQEWEQLNELASVHITYQLPDGEKVLDGNEVRQWLTVDEEGNYNITEKELRTKAAEYVADLANEVDTVGTARNFASSNRGVIKVSGGSYGYKIHQKLEIKQIIEEITNHSVIERTPIYRSAEVTVEKEGIGNTYVEIDLSNQKLWYYMDGELYLQSSIVSGTYTVPNRRTPAGIYLLSYKARDVVLRGARKKDGTYEYQSPVSYWMPFNGGIGLHDATWRSSFGGSVYMYSGSHGCINLPYDKAKAIYTKINTETPIVLYY